MLFTVVSAAGLEAHAATAVLAVHATLRDPLTHIERNQVSDESDVRYTHHADHNVKQDLLPQYRGQRAARVGDEVDHEVHIDDDEEQGEAPYNKLHNEIVRKFAHELGGTGEMQHGEQREGQLDALQDVQPLVRTIGKGRVRL